MVFHVIKAVSRLVKMGLRTLFSQINQWDDPKVAALKLRSVEGQEGNKGT